MLAIALILSFLPAAPFDCKGKPDVPLSYFVWTERIVQTGSIIDAQGASWPTYTRTFLTVPIAEAPLMEVELADPAVGGGMFYRVFDRDPAGNDDCETEEPTP
jgi:hypothetical protein